MKYISLCLILFLSNPTRKDLYISQGNTYPKYLKLKKVIKKDWSIDTFGCKGYRLKYKEFIIENAKNIKGLGITEILYIFGVPNSAFNKCFGYTIDMKASYCKHLDSLAYYDSEEIRFKFKNEVVDSVYFFY
jgi:hypothetical protein